MGCANERPILHQDSCMIIENTQTSSTSSSSTSSNSKSPSSKEVNTKLPHLVFNQDKKSVDLLRHKQYPQNSSKTDSKNDSQQVQKEEQGIYGELHYAQDCVQASISSIMGSNYYSQSKLSQQSRLRPPSSENNLETLSSNLVNLTQNEELNKYPPSLDEVLHIGRYLDLSESHSGISTTSQIRNIQHSFDPSFAWKQKKQTLNQSFNESDLIQERNNFYEKYFHDAYSLQREEFNKKLSNGPTQELRWVSWKTKLLNRQEYRKFFGFSDICLYSQMLSISTDSKSEERSSNNLYLIRKDTKRTFPEQKYFEQIGQPQLLRSLHAISNFYQNTGYCQGMNFIIGMLLLVSGGNEVESFECFVSLSFRKEFLLVGMFEDGFPLLKYLEIVFEDLFITHFPKLHKHFKKEEVANQIWLTKWVMTLYLYSFPLSSCLRIIDYLISSDVFALIYIALAILKQIEQRLLEMDGVDISMFFSEKLQVPIHKNSNQETTTVLKSVYEQQQNQKQLSEGEDDGTEIFDIKTEKKQIQSKLNEGSSEVEEEEQIILKISDIIDIEIAIKDAKKFTITQSVKFVKYAEIAKAEISLDYCNQIENLNQRDTGFDGTILEYKNEMNNIIFFIQYFALSGNQAQQQEYLELIKQKYINKNVLDGIKNKKAPKIKTKSENK